MKCKNCGKYLIDSYFDMAYVNGEPILVLECNQCGKVWNKDEEDITEAYYEY